MKRGWFGHRFEHGLAARGIRIKNRNTLTHFPVMRLKKQVKVQQVDRLPNDALAGWDHKGTVFVSREGSGMARKPLIEKALLVHELGHAKFDMLSNAKRRAFLEVIDRLGLRPQDFGYDSKEAMASEIYAFIIENNNVWAHHRQKMPPRMKEKLLEELRKRGLFAQ